MSMHFEFNQVPNIEIYRSDGSHLVDFHEYTDEEELVTTVSLGDFIRGLGITLEDCKKALEPFPVSGTFTLTSSGRVTRPLRFDATPEEIQEALDAS